MTEVDIISGFLGAGKTTFMKKLVSDVFSDEKVVIVENEFGEIGIDSGFLKDTGIQVSEINGGCVCCTLVGDFTKNLHDVIRTYHPDRILIEPSGVAKLSDIEVSVLEVGESEEINVGALVTIVNALKARKQIKAFGEFFNDQIEHATAVVLSRTQKMEEDKLEALVDQIKLLNKEAVVITTPWDQLDGKKIFDAITGKDNLAVFELAAKHHEEEEAEHHHDHEGHCHHDHDHDEHDHHDHDHDEHDHHDHEHDEHEHGGHCHHHHHADDIFTTWGRETAHKFTRETIENALKAMSESDEYGYIVRSKGIVPAEDGTWIYFDLVEGEYQIRSGEADVTGRLVVIGTDVKEDKVEELFGI